VLCPTIAVEEMVAHPGFRHLADALSKLGFVVVRFDYPATGDSFGDLEPPSLLERWLGAIDDAITLVRARGADHVGLLGLRIGAILAALASARDGRVGALALWDPAPSGRAFLRAQEALRGVSIGPSAVVGTPPLPEGSVELLGVVLSAAAAGELGQLDLAAIDRPMAHAVLALVREGQSLPPKLAARLEAEGAIVRPCAEQSAFIDVLPDDAVLPFETLEGIASWFDATLHGPWTPIRTAPPSLEARTVGSGGRLISERCVRFGPLGLFGIVTEPDVGASGPAVVLLNAGLLRHTGPARLWVTLARELASSGMRVLRFDLAGIGDSPERPGSRRQLSYPAGAIDDIETAIHTIAPDGPGTVILGGLCAGAYHSIEAGLALGTLGACAINPILAFDPSTVCPDGDPRLGRAAVQPYHPLIRRLRRNPRIRELGERYLPRAFWWALDRIGVQPAPARGVAALVDRGCDVLLICGDVEAPPFTQRSPRQMRAMRASGRLDFALLSGADHALFGAAGRQRAAQIVIDHIQHRWGERTASEPRPAVAPSSAQ
jgi:alpha-beta hydrolase superfamily lysophospholipase